MVVVVVVVGLDATCAVIVIAIDGFRWSLSKETHGPPSLRVLAVAFSDRVTGFCAACPARLPFKERRESGLETASSSSSNATLKCLCACRPLPAASSSRDKACKLHLRTRLVVTLLARSPNCHVVFCPVLCQQSNRPNLDLLFCSILTPPSSTSQQGNTVHPSAQGHGSRLKQAQIRT